LLFVCPVSLILNSSIPSSMKTVAVVGGTSGLGLHIVEAIYKCNNDWRLVVLSRSSKPILGLPSVPVIAVSYDPEGSERLVNVLKSNRVHTVICTIGALNIDLEKSQLAVLNAAVNSGVVRRFVPSEWAGIRSEYR
jgi:NAD(P)-dependent dehydrogenase (short-subunit alcohol dehydrogenase family)